MDLVPSALRPACGGLLAAATGYGALAAVALLLWTVSPHMAGGPADVLRACAGVWLLAHGADLLRADTLSGIPAPVGPAPLLVTALVAWRLHRALRLAGPGPLPAACVVGGYLLAGAAAVLLTRDAPLAARPGSAACHLPVFAAAVAAVSLGARWAPPVLATALRAAAAATAALVGVGLLLVAAGLAAGAEAAGAGLAQLGGAWQGQVAVALLSIALLPNAAVWAAAYGLGPGFSLGTAGGGVATGTDLTDVVHLAARAPVPAVSGLADLPGLDALAGRPTPAAGGPRLPPLPLLAAVPDAPPGNASQWAAVAAVPAAGVLVAAWWAARRPDATATDTALTALLAAVGQGLGIGALAALSGGALGSNALAMVGPAPLPTALTAACCTAALAPPLALALWAWRRRGAAWRALWPGLWPGGRAGGRHARGRGRPEPAVTPQPGPWPVRKP